MKTMTRVTRRNPCPICGKTDWCMIGDAWILCMRVASDKQKKLADDSVGWLHATGEHSPPVKHHTAERPATILNVAHTLEVWHRAPTRSLAKLSCNLGVTKRSLEQLECVAAPYHQTWAFPMRAGDGGYTGIRLRRDDGEKWAERGSHQGLFIPNFNPRASDTCLVVEGPTDCAAALTLGYYAIGRPNCCGGIEHLKVAVKRLNIRRCVIVSDLDDPGLRGASTLAAHLDVPCAIMVCPAKDLRQFVANGGTAETMDAMIRQLVWRSERESMFIKRQ